MSQISMSLKGLALGLRFRQKVPSAVLVEIETVQFQASICKKTQKNANLIQCFACQKVYVYLPGHFKVSPPAVQ